MIDAVCIWDPVYRGREGWSRRKEKLIMLEGKYCLYVFVFLYICLAKGNLIFPMMGWGLRPLCHLTCSIVCRSKKVTCGVSSRFRVPKGRCATLPCLWLPCPPPTPPTPPVQTCRPLLMIHYLRT